MQSVGLVACALIISLLMVSCSPNSPGGAYKDEDIIQLVGAWSELSFEENPQVQILERGVIQERGLLPVKVQRRHSRRHVFTGKREFLEDTQIFYVGRNEFGRLTIWNEMGASFSSETYAKAKGKPMPPASQYLFVERPSQTALDAIQAKITSIQFFESPSKVMPAPENRKFTNLFVFQKGGMDRIRNICVQLNLSYPALARQHALDLEARWFGRNGREWYRNTLIQNLQPGWTNSWSVLCFGQPAGSFYSGSYRTEIYVGEHKVGVGVFEIVEK